MDTEKLEKLLRGKIVSNENDKITIEIPNTHEELALVIDTNIVADLLNHQERLLDFVKSLKRKKNRSVTREIININKRNYKIFI